MLTINNLDKIIGYSIGYSFSVKSMVCGHVNYHISLTHGRYGCRDLKLSRMIDKRGRYRISHGNYSLYLKFSDIQNINLFCAHLKTLLC